jgi:hypothetical protein
MSLKSKALFWRNCLACGFSSTELTDKVLKEDPVFWPSLASVVFGLVILTLLAWLLWKLACIRFSRELERPRG